MNCVTNSATVPAGPEFPCRESWTWAPNRELGGWHAKHRYIARDRAGVSAPDRHIPAAAAAGADGGGDRVAAREGRAIRRRQGAARTQLAGADRTGRHRQFSA